MNEQLTGTERQLRAARIAVAYVFFANGALAGNWVVRIPALMDRLGLSVSALGFAFFAAPLAAILAMPLAGRLITHAGSRRTTRVSFFVFCAAILPIPFSPDLVVLGLAIFVIGAVSSFLDVAMNANGLALEHRFGRPILSSFHAWFSIGGLAGSGTGALAAWAALDIRLHIPIAVAVAVVGGLVLTPFLYRGADDAEQERRRFFVKPPRQLVALGFVAFISLLAEGAVGDWSAVYIDKPLQASKAVAALGYFAFSFMMVAGRSYGDRLTTRFGPVVLTRAGGLLAAASLTCALLIGHPVAAIIGFAGMGAGLAVVVPTVFRAAGSHATVPSAIGLASVSMIGYFGFLVGPPLIGSASHFIGLPKALGIVALFMAAIGLLAASAAPTRARAQEQLLAAGEG
jgi:MFS family permease